MVQIYKTGIVSAGGTVGDNIITNFDTSLISIADGATTIMSNQTNGGVEEILSNFMGANKVVHVHGNGGNNRVYFTRSVTSGSQYTMSVDFYSSSSLSTAIHYELNGGDYSWYGGAVGYSDVGKWKRLSLTTPVLTSNTTFYYFLYTKTDVDIYATNFKLEVGSKPTPWIPNSSSTMYVGNSVGFMEYTPPLCSVFNHRNRADFGNRIHRNLNTLSERRCA